MAKRKIEVYYSRKSKTVYLMMPNGESYFLTNTGKVGQTSGSRGSIKYTGQMYENASFVAELTPAALRRLKGT